MTGSQQDHGHHAHAVAVGHGPRKRRRMALRMALPGGAGPTCGAGPIILVRSRFMLRMLYGSAICFAVRDDRGARPVVATVRAVQLNSIWRHRG